jgi:hypothetical protein
VAERKEGSVVKYEGANRCWSTANYDWGEFGDGEDEDVFAAEEDVDELEPDDVSVSF